MDMEHGNVTRLRCVVCKRWEKRINNVKGFMFNWIRPGTQSIKKDGVKTHCNSMQHKEAVRLDERNKMGASAYAQEVVKSSPIGRGLKKMCEKDISSMCVKFNATYYLAKKERPFSDYPDLLALHKKNKVKNIGKSYATDRACAVFADSIGGVMKETFQNDIAKARFFCVLNDGSTDSSVKEQELVYILYMSEGVAKVKYLSIESVENATAPAIKDAISEAFKRFGVKEMPKHLLGLNVDGASVNTGIHSGLGALMKEDSPWLQTVIALTIVLSWP